MKLIAIPRNLGSYFEKKIKYFYLGIPLSVHHAVPVSICPGSPGRYYSRHVPAPRTTRLNHLPIHAPYYNHHPESEGKDLIILNLRKSSSSCSLCQVERLRVFPKHVYIYWEVVFFNLFCTSSIPLQCSGNISGNRLRSADYSRFSSFDIYSSIHPFIHPTFLNLHFLPSLQNEIIRKSVLFTTMNLVIQNLLKSLNFFQSNLPNSLCILFLTWFL